MDTPRRIQRKRTKGWKMPPNTVSVTRPGKWGNPFKVGSLVRHKLNGHGGQHETFVTDSAHAVRLFKKFIARKPDIRIGAKIALKGKNLACFCPLDQPCHADVLLEIANGD